MSENDEATKSEQAEDRLKRAVANLTLDNLILKEAAEGNFCALHVATGVWSMSEAGSR